MSCLITMSQKELHRLELIQQFRGRSLTVVEAASQPASPQGLPQHGARPGAWHNVDLGSTWPPRS